MDDGGASLVSSHRQTRRAALLTAGPGCTERTRTSLNLDADVMRDICAAGNCQLWMIWVTALLKAVL